MNLVNCIGNKVTVWTAEGNSLHERKLVTVDELGVVVEAYQANESTEHDVFIPWNRIKYINIPKKETTASTHDFLKVHHPTFTLFDAGETVFPLGDKIPVEHIPENGGFIKLEPLDAFAIYPDNRAVVKLEYVRTDLETRKTLSDFYTTSELHEILAKREGVRSVGVPPHEKWQIIRIPSESTDDWTLVASGVGPTRFIINQD